ncbi:MAG: Ribosomal RNA large subunit methyltransferase F [Owenweeksia sp. TMED14]|nr:MAG: Ribosomal RNA large subunit methyltransferase F [Owenweeksia sp. TMED14]
MHPDNPFNKNYNFNELTESHPKLSTFVIPGRSERKSIDFSRPEAVIALNTALLKKTFDINWKLKPGNLCPAVPGRLDYLFYAKDLLGDQKSRNVNLLDIGTGASLIYPLLATAAFNWNCTASEVDEESLNFAKNILLLNPKLKTTTLRGQPFKSKILERIVEENDYFDLVICNPPFHKTQSDAEKQNIRKNKNLHNKKTLAHNFGGNSNELWYKGGEVAFIKAMALESARFKMQVEWFTCLVSNAEHIKNLKRCIMKSKPTEIRIVEMAQGNKQSRFIAWTFK